MWMIMGSRLGNLVLLRMLGLLLKQCVNGNHILNYLRRFEGAVCFVVDLCLMLGKPAKRPTGAVCETILLAGERRRTEEGQGRKYQGLLNMKPYSSRSRRDLSMLLLNNPLRVLFLFREHLFPWVRPSILFAIPTARTAHTSSRKVVDNGRGRCECVCKRDDREERRDEERGHQ